MVSIPDMFTDKNPITPGPYVTVKKPSAIKLLLPFSEVLDVKHKTYVRRLVLVESKRKSELWSSIPNRRGHIKINERVQKSFTVVFYNILRLFIPQSPIIA